MTDASANQITLSSLAIGSRLVVRSKLDWRFAVISRIGEERVTLIVCSPGGRTYRLWRKCDTELLIEGSIPVLQHATGDSWRDNFSSYDTRW